MKHTIESLKGMSDAELGGLLGHDQQLAELKDGLKEADALKGDARKRVEDRIAAMMQPHVYPGEIKHMVAAAKRKEQSGKEAMADCSCCSVID